MEFITLRELRSAGTERRREKAQLALARLREAAHTSGRDKLTAEEIEAEIAAARAERCDQPAGDQPA